MCHPVIHNIQRKWLHLRLQPIRVFCFHQVSEQFDPSTMWECDWTQIEQFKHTVLRLKKQYTFISLSEAYEKLKQDKIRRTRYAVLTADDGWASLKNILPWLSEQKIPVTLFVNPAYLLGKETREKGENNLLSWDELTALVHQYPSVSVASHGWNHTMAVDMTESDFLSGIQRSHQFLRQCNRYLPFYAYPCGRRAWRHNVLLHQCGIVPVYIDRMKNYKFDGGIHRESLDGLCL